MVLLTDAIVSLRPGSHFILIAEDYEQLNWLDDSTKPPTLKECQTEIVRLTAIETSSKQAAEDKLAKLGLTTEDLKMLLG